ncbi:MAG: hypothetical protein RL375_1896 [Pseudomonadota bacterium]|jgi:hypothetical protein
MAGKAIEATLRVAADFSRALAELRAFKKEAGPTTAVAAGGQQADKSKAKADQAALTADNRAATSEHEQQAARRSAADRAAAAEALAAQKAALRAQRDADRAAARERREAEDTERRAKRKAQAQSDREELAATSRKQRAAREEQRKLTQVAPQVTDIVTGLAGGQNPLMVALQQGGQLRDIFGGAGNAARALMSAITPMRVAVVGVGAAFAVVVSQIIAGHAESEKLRHTLALTGNAAGTSLGQINSLAQGIAQQTGAGIGTVRDIMQALLSVAGQTSNTLGETGRAAAALARLSGASADEAVKAFEDQAAGVTDWARKANKAYNFLTAEQVAYIRRLEAQGRSEEAIRFVNGKLADTLQQRTGPALGTLEKAWAATTRAVGGFLDMLKAIGRDETTEDKLKKLQTRLEALRAVPQRGRAPRPGREQINEAPVLQERNTILRDQLRASERSGESKAEQQGILEQTKAWQESLTAVTLAGAQKRLQGQLAALDKQQAAVELADARGLVSERDKALALNRIDQDRLRAQIALQQLQAGKARAAIDLESNPQDKRGAEARAIEAEAQLIALQGRLQATIADAQRITEADALAKSRERAQEWAQIWQQADQQVRQLTSDNALSDAAQQGDPRARAQAEAQVRVDALRREIDATVRDLRVQISLAITPEARKDLQQQVGALLLEGSQALREVGRTGVSQSLQTQLGEQLDSLRLKEEALALAVSQGAMSTEDAERRKFEARAAALPQLLAQLELLKATARTESDRNAIAALQLQLQGLADKTTEVEATLKGSIGSGFADFFTSVATGAERADRAFGNFVAGVLRSMLNLIARRLGEQLVNSLFNSQGNGAGNWLAQLFTTAVTTKHSGGLIDGAMTATRNVAPWVFHGAQILHSGGIAGLRSGEVPAVLMKGEEVLTADDPRHRNNLARAGGSGGPLIGNLNVAVSTDGTGTAAGDAALAQRLGGALKSFIEQKLAEEMRPGGMLQNLARG